MAWIRDGSVRSIDQSESKNPKLDAAESELSWSVSALNWLEDTAVNTFIYSGSTRSKFIVAFGRDVPEGVATLKPPHLMRFSDVSKWLKWLGEATHV